MKALHSTSAVKTETSTPVKVSNLFVFWFFVSQSLSASLYSRLMSPVSAGEGGFQNSSFVVRGYRAEYWKASIVQQSTPSCSTQKQQFCPFFLPKCLWASFWFSCWSAGAVVGAAEKRRKVCLCSSELFLLLPKFFISKQLRSILVTQNAFSMSW